MAYNLKVNGRSSTVDVPADTPLLWVIRDVLNLHGTKFGCGIGACRACVIIWDHDDGTSEAIPTCITAAASFDGKRVRTIEGHAADGPAFALRLRGGATAWQANDGRLKAGGRIELFTHDKDHALRCRLLRPHRPRRRIQLANLLRSPPRKSFC